MKKLQFVQNDTRPQLIFTVMQDGVVVDLTGATVRFKARLFDVDITLFNRACTLLVPASGTCSFDFQATDLATVGYYRAELEVTFPDNTVNTCRDFIEYYVREEL